MYCRKCGKEIDDNVSFCRFCGTNVEQIVVEKQNSHAGFNTVMELVVTLISFVLMGFAIANIVAFFLPIGAWEDYSILDLIKEGEDFANYGVGLFASITSVGLLVFSFNKKKCGSVSLVLSVIVAILDLIWVNNYASWIQNGYNLFEILDEFGSSIITYQVCFFGVLITGVAKSILLALVKHVNNPSKFAEGI